MLTILFVPNIMTLDLREGDRRFDALMAGNPAAYNGEAVAPKNLSLYERCAPRAGSLASGNPSSMHASALTLESCSCACDRARFSGCLCGGVLKGLQCQRH